MSGDGVDAAGEELSRKGERGGLGSRIHARFEAAGRLDVPEREKLFEDSAASIIGKVVLAFSRFELNLTILLETLVTPENGAEIDRLFKRTLGVRIEGVQSVLSSRAELDPSCLAEFADWKLRMDGVRLLRNRFVHGRWGILAHAQQIASVASYRAKAPADNEIRYSLVELEAELGRIEEVCAGFIAWRKRWPI
ncbi:hypothetical protein [Pseudomonas multiresinivorans]|uniref:MAE-28990/MAE-18760-like HEPN domain-containing protein n=1 Tax=Pseudomonas multiresinivorans TaxID=95301 RepID=A0A7Z3GPL5_9PSED|nr:hypothetical protein [Pseudomonas multiresinivorans]QJP07789.1 hypothetical protein G4G71_07840 [Pseudomonas multiresinivorans]